MPEASAVFYLTNNPEEGAKMPVSVSEKLSLIGDGMETSHRHIPAYRAMGALELFVRVLDEAGEAGDNPLRLKEHKSPAVKELLIRVDGIKKFIPTPPERDLIELISSLRAGHRTVESLVEYLTDSGTFSRQMREWLAFLELELARRTLVPFSTQKPLGEAA